MPLLSFKLEFTALLFDSATLPKTIYLFVLCTIRVAMHNNLHHVKLLMAVAEVL